MSVMDLLTCLMNDKFVKYVADFISNAWYKRQHDALYNETHITLFFYILLLLLSLYCMYLLFVHLTEINNIYLTIHL